jgi:hypothetical protein
MNPGFKVTVEVFILVKFWRIRKAAKKVQFFTDAPRTIPGQSYCDAPINYPES